jgi:hypothetical protein
MGRYTLHDDPKVDDKIQSDLDVIVSEVLTSMHPTSIILAGSFGRGEGSVLCLDDQIIKVKDYDIIFVVDKSSRLTPEKLKELKIRATKGCIFGELEDRYALSDHHLDFYQFTPGELFGEGHLKFSNDLKYAGIVLYGKDIRGQIEPDIEDLALSRCYYSLLKSVKNLLKQFSVAYFRSPPEGLSRFSLIFFLSNVYLHMGTQLTLCHDLYHPTCMVRGERLREHYARLCPELAQKLPNLPDKINFFADLRLFPNKIDHSGIDPVALWFDTRHDFDLVMRYCLNTAAHLDSDDWTILSGRLCRSLMTNYYSSFFEYYLKRRYGLRSPVMTSLKNRAYQLHHTRKYARWLQTEHRFQFRIFFETPVLTALAISPLLLFSLRRDGSVDPAQFSAFWREFQKIYPCAEAGMQVPNPTNWEAAKSILYKNLHID